MCAVFCKIILYMLKKLNNIFKNNPYYYDFKCIKINCLIFIILKHAIKNKK